MSLGYWIHFIIVFTLGVILVQFSHGKLTGIIKLTMNFSPAFLKILRYLGLFIIIYSCYGVIIDYTFFY